MRHSKICWTTGFIALFFFLSAPVALPSGPASSHMISGKTMGTYYRIKFISDDSISLSLWEKKVNILLKDINKKMSMFDPNSELSQFNRQPSLDSFHISPDFFRVLQTAKHLHTLTNGSWDGTVKPLVDLWGFGTKKGRQTIPDPEKIKSALGNTGYSHIVLLPPNHVRKSKPVTLDLGSIAKGYGVDKMARLFKSSGIHDVLVEIGGELSASGKNKTGNPWTIGISQPDKKLANQTLHTVLKLKNKSIATSGDYRNFFEKNGKTYSHVIDPKTGYPVKTQIASASVISTTCTFADGLATALMVMDVEKGLTLVNDLEDTECLIIEKKGRQFISHTSKNFNQLVHP